MIHPVRIDKKHRYWARQPEIQVPGFTEICNAMGVTRPNPHHTEQGRAEGVALHLWLGFLVRGKVPKTAPDPLISGRVEGIKKFIIDTRFKIIGGEEPRYDPVTNAACTKDLWGHIGLWSIVIDAKRGAKQLSHRLQTACQKICLAANDFRAQKRAALYLRDGDFRLDEHSGPEDEKNWRAIAEGYHTMTPDERAVFASDEFIEDPNPANVTSDLKKWRSIINAHNARSFYRR